MRMLAVSLLKFSGGALTEYRLVGQGTHISAGDAEQPRTCTTVTRVPGAPFPLSQSSHPLRLSRQRFGGHSEADLSVADL